MTLFHYFCLPLAVFAVLFTLLTPLRYIHTNTSPSSTTGADWLWTTEAAHQVLAYGGRLSGVCPQPWGFPNPMLNPTGPQVDPGSFTTMLSALLTARTAAVAAHSLWELAGKSVEGRGGVMEEFFVG